MKQDLKLWKARSHDFSLGWLISGARTSEARKAEARGLKRGGVLVEGQPAHPQQLDGLWNAVSSSSGVRGKAFSGILWTPGGFTWHFKSTWPYLNHKLLQSI